jgi:hypothetical protein
MRGPSGSVTSPGMRGYNTVTVKHHPKHDFFRCPRQEVNLRHPVEEDGSDATRKGRFWRATALLL